MGDVNKTRVVTEASLLSRGYIKQDEDGIELTPKGLDEAHNRWIGLSAENRLLLGIYVKRLLWEHYGSK